ncbi:MAG: VOC family protein [Rhodomicrobium sp.]
MTASTATKKRAVSAAHKAPAKAVKPKKFVWYDVMTTDVAAASAFYSKVVGWTVADSGSEPAYLLLSAGPDMVGGIMPIPEEIRASGARPTWFGYIGVDDADVYAKRVTKAGGKIHRGPKDIPGIGRFAVASDPHGATFILFTPSGETEQPPAEPGVPDHVGWRELHAGDLDSAWKFYSGLFGWKKAEAMEMGAMDFYQTFETGNTPGGGMMTKRPDSPAPFWLYYFNVDAIDQAAAREWENGGKIIMGPHKVPGDLWIVQCTDPQGAMFALLAPKR